MPLRIVLCCLALLWPLAAAATSDWHYADLPAATQQQLREQIYNKLLPPEQRIAALKKLFSFSDQAPMQRTVCIWDIAGRAGPIYTAARDQRAELMRYGVDVDMVVYTNEGVMVEELKAGRCDAALMSGLRARLFNNFSGTIDSVGGLPTDEHMHRLLELLTDVRLADRLTSQDYVVMGIAPGGGAYIFVNDKRINSLAKAAGKRVPVLEYDPVQARMVAQIGATPVGSDLLSAPTKFNNGSVDVLPAPLIAYEILELYKGLGKDGGIIDYPLAQISVQLIGRTNRFPPEVAQLVREAFFSGYEDIMVRLRAEAAKVPAHWWISIPDADKQGYETLMQDARIQLRDEGYYNAEMLTIQRRLRCHLEPTRSECAQPVE
ncbi:putative solute-binding protein [Isoalcanivorax beigongshangi]|uniref:Solute-binding protein n=1 Tax=Isoalcanivorax beigongshangi TaxID=3238810 RepID=A0ABV4AJE3_9GAMM